MTHELRNDQKDTIASVEVWENGEGRTELKVTFSIEHYSWFLLGQSDITLVIDDFIEIGALPDWNFDRSEKALSARPEPEADYLYVTEYVRTMLTGIAGKYGLTYNKD